MSARTAKCKVLFMQSQDYFGADSMIHRLIMQHLDRQEFEVHVACSTSSRDRPSRALSALADVDDLHVRPTDFGPTANNRPTGAVLRDAGLRGPGAAVDLLRLVAYARRQGIDIVHGTEKPRDAFYGLLVARAVGAKCVTHLHVKAEGWISPLSRWAMARDDALIGVSDFVSESLVDMGFSSSKIHTVLNALDMSEWHPSPADSSVRREFGIAADVPLLVTASRLFPWKGHSELLRALDQVQRSGRAFHLLIVGEDDPRATPGGGSFLADLKSLISALALRESVTFTGFRSDVRSLMSAADIFVMPSFEEPFGVVYLEAMALATPVVALDNGGTKEVVQHGATGLLSAPGDTDGLARHIELLLDDEGRRRTMGRAGRDLVESKFNPSRLAADVEGIYRVLLSTDARSADGQRRVPHERRRT